MTNRISKGIEAEFDRDFAAIHNAIFYACQAKGVRVSVSRSRLADVAVHQRKDILKLMDHQGESISVTKRVAGLAFWIRRIKPITYACRENDPSGMERDIQDINEQCAIWIATSMLLKYAESKNKYYLFSSDTKNNWHKDFKNYIGKYWSIDQFSKYHLLIYSLHYRNFSPHHIALLLDSIVIGFRLKMMG